MLYKDVLVLWINEKRVEVRNSTLKNYSGIINKWILPELGNMQIEDITRAHLQNFILCFAKNHKHNTVINLSKPLSSSFRFAVLNNIITLNPWNSIKIPKDFIEKDINVFSKEEVRLLLSYAFPEYRRDIILLGYRTGMRIGEILTLKYDDIDFNNGFLTVKRTLSGYKNNKPEITVPKTKSARRRIELDSKTMEMLARRELVSTEDYVFCKQGGDIYSRQSINLPKMCLALGLKPRTFHSLRHTHATILLSSGVHPKIVQERLGHAKISTTLDIYSHVVPGMQKAAVRIFESI